MKVGIVGLGLIGASMAEALKKRGHQVLGVDKNKTTQNFAKLAGSIDGVLDDEEVSTRDIIFLAVTPHNAVKWVKDNSEKGLINPDSIIIDCCGTKKRVCEECFPIAKEKGFHFIGGHPMAGKQVGGYKNSSPDLFKGALFALIPNNLTEDGSDIGLMQKVKALLKDAGFAEFSVMSPEDHDKVIAFTSQMAHLVSNAYIKSDMAEVGVGVALSGGAFRDMTRVAYLDENMWTELFLENKENLLGELEGFISELEKYKEAIRLEDREHLSKLLAEGKERKAEIMSGESISKTKEKDGPGKENGLGKDSETCVSCKLEQ